MSRQWILLRGLAREQEHWIDFKNQIQKLDPLSEVIGIDLPGAGTYHKLSSPMSIPAISEFIYSQLPAKKQNTQRVVIAISLGGMVATEMVKKYPLDFEGLVLINSSFKNFSSVFQRLQTEALIYFYRALTAQSLFQRERAVLDMVSNLPSDQKDAVAHRWAQISQQRPIMIFNFFKQLLAAALYEAPEQKPLESVLVLTSISDNMVNFRCSKSIAERWSVPIEIHETSGHEMTLDVEGWVIEKVFQYFKKDEQSLDQKK